MLNEYLKTRSFLIFLHDPRGRTVLYEMGTKWWNTNYIQKIVCMTNSQGVHDRITVDLQIRLEDHLSSWELFCLNVGKIVHSSSGFQHRAMDVVDKFNLLESVFLWG